MVTTMKGALLLRREYKCYPEWYDRPLKDFKKSHPSVAYAAYYNKTKRAGNWEGFFVQKIGKLFCAIWFGQLSEYPAGFSCFTGDTIVAKADTLEGAIDGFVQNMPVADKSQWQTL